MVEVPKSLIANDLISWWVWCAWIEKGPDRKFLYGCAARTHRSPGWTGKVRRQELPGGGELIYCQRTVTMEEFEAFYEPVSQDILRLAALMDVSVPEATVLASRRVIQSALGHEAARVDCYYTLPDFDLILDSNRDAWRVALSTLQAQLGLPFQTSYAGRTGNFEIFELNSWLDRAQPFQIEAIPSAVNPADLGPRILRIGRARDFARDEHIAHIVGRVGDDVLLDRLVTLRPGQEMSEPLDCTEPLVEFDFRLFDATGVHLLHFEHRVFMRGVDLNLAPVSRQYNIDDKLTARAEGKSAELAKAARSVAGYTSTRSAVRFGKDGPWRAYSDGMRDRADSLFAKPSEDKWFAPGVESEIAIIQHFNLLLHGGRAQSAVLVDPWFGEHALRQFALRLGSQDLKLTIVTSWTNVDPDNNERLDPSKNPTEKLERALAELQPLVNPNLKVINLCRGNAQAFHDRYLVVYPFNGPPKVYLLSNSINKMGGDWPFCMSLIAPDVASRAQTYIEGLCRGVDTNREMALTVTLEWPANAA